MRQVGVVRRMDDLGRIVIPKEIRNLLNIKNGELLSIIVNDDNIILKKENESLDIYNIIENLVNIYESLYEDVIIFTDREKVISYGNVDLIDYSLDDMHNYISEFDQYISEIKETKTIGKLTIEGYYLIVPIFLNSNFFGKIIIVSKDIDNLILNKYISKFMLQIIDNKVDIT